VSDGTTNDRPGTEAAGPGMPASLGADPVRTLDREDLRSRIQKTLDDVVARQMAVLEDVSVELTPLTDALVDLLRGGKRLRPAFCYWGWRGAAGPDEQPIVDAAASLELFHAAALIHDDVMDASDTRRGMPAAHRRFAQLHRDNHWLGDPESFGRAGAVLLGDLCLSWSDELFTGSGLSPEQMGRGRRLFDVMRTQLMGGQYLDMLAQVRPDQPTGAAQRARTVIRFKSAKYTVEHPLLLGGSLAGGSPELLRAYCAYGLPLGEAFQLRDDVLGVFGDPAETGKPAGDDLREGKRTVLIATALEYASPAQAAVLRRHLGDPRLDAPGVATLRGILIETGALDRVERLIVELTEQALAVGRGGRVAEPARSILCDLAVAATARTV
jgi:geranylgeranyl diphosphate synthase type I